MVTMTMTPGQRLRDGHSLVLFIIAGIIPEIRGQKLTNSFASSGTVFKLVSSSVDKPSTLSSLAASVSRNRIMIKLRKIKGHEMNQYTFLCLLLSKIM